MRKLRLIMKNLKLFRRRMLLFLILMTVGLLCGCHKKEETVTYYEGNTVDISIADAYGNRLDEKNGETGVYRLIIGQRYTATITCRNSVGASIPFRAEDVDIYYSSESLSFHQAPIDEDIEYCSSVEYSIVPLNEVQGLSCVVMIGVDSGNFSYEIIKPTAEVTDEFPSSVTSAVEMPE